MTVSATSSSTATTASGASTTKLAENFDTFLKLLTTQLQYQDPLSPMDTNQFTEQLVQFTSVEQSIQTNKNLESLIGLFQSSNLSNATSYIGKEVVAASDFASLDDDGASWTYTLGAAAAETKLTIYNDKGTKVFETTGDTEAGRHDFAWDGRDANGNALPDGVYQMVVSAKTASGGDIDTGLYIRAKVDGVGVDSGRVSLVVDGLAIDPSQIVAVMQPGQTGSGGGTDTTDTTDGTDGTDTADSGNNSGSDTEAATETAS